MLCCPRGCAEPPSLSPQVHPAGEPGCCHHPALVPAALAAAQDGGRSSGAPDGCQERGRSCPLLCSPDPLTPVSHWPRNWGPFSPQTWAGRLEGFASNHPLHGPESQGGFHSLRAVLAVSRIRLGWVPAGAVAQRLGSTQLQFPQPPDWEQADAGRSSTRLSELPLSGHTGGRRRDAPSRLILMNP